MNCPGCEIKKLIYRYADHIDRGELAAVAALFARGKIIAIDGDGNDQDIIGEAAIHVMYSAFTRLYPDSGTPHTLHMTSNVMVDVDDSGTVASAQFYAMVFQSVDTLPLQPIIGVRYYDAFEKTADGWHFVQRKIEPLLSGDLSQHLLQAP